MDQSSNRRSPRTKLQYPQEIEVWFVIPAIHRNLAQQFKKNNLTQRKSAKILGVTEACVSQYLNSIRGTKVSFSKSIQKDIEAAAKRILNEGTAVIKEVQEICLLIKNSGLLCELHKQYGNTSDSCEICKSLGGEKDSV